jgi:hypothetical protein
MNVLKKKKKGKITGVLLSLSLSLSLSHTHTHTHTHTPMWGHSKKVAFCEPVKRDLTGELNWPELCS